MEFDKFLKLLHSKGDEQELLFKNAREIRTKYFGGKVFFRAVIEITNYCECNCLYCGMRKDNETLDRSRLDVDSIKKAIDSVEMLNVETLMFQGGQDNGYSSNDIKEIIKYAKQKEIKNIILCMGYRSQTDYQNFYDLGANKYIMKFETSNEQNYRTMKNGESINTRLEHLNTLKKIGYDIGSGNIYGLPGQSEEDLYKDLVLMKELKCNLASVSPFIVPSQSVLEGVYNAKINNALNYLAIMRLELESALIPSVSAFELLKENGQLDAFNAGANVITINMTPAVFRESYPIYNSKRNIVKFDYAKNVIENAGLSLAVES